MRKVYLPRLREVRSISEARKVGTHEEILAQLDLIKQNPPQCLEDLVYLFEKEGELDIFFGDIDERNSTGKLLHPMKQGGVGEFS